MLMVQKHQLARQARALGHSAPSYTVHHAFFEACIEPSHRAERIMTHILKMEALAMSHHEGLGAGSMPPDILHKFRKLSIEIGWLF